MAEKTLYLVRHALPEYPGGTRMCLGQSQDVPLSREGFAQASELGRIFVRLSPEAVYTSPLLRARQTAEGLSGGRAPVVILPELIELNGGAWDGQPMDVIRRCYPEYFRRGTDSTCPPGGETDEEGKTRLFRALEEIDRRTQTCAALVAHAGVNRVLLCALMQRPFCEKKLIPQRHASINVLVRRNGVWQVERAGILPEEWNSALKTGEKKDD